MVLGASVSTFAILSNQTGLQTPAGISWAGWESMCLFNFHLWSYLMITFPSSDQSIGHSLKRLLLCAICGSNCSVYRPDLFPLTTWVKNDGDYTRLTHPHAHTHTLTHVQFFSTLPLLWSRPLPPPVEMPLVDSSSLCSSSWTFEPWEILALHWLLITLRTWSQPFTSIQRPFMSSVSISSCSFPTSSSSHLRLHATALLNYLSRALPLMGPRINASLWQEHSSLPSFLILSSLSAYFFIVRLRVSTWTWQPSGGIHRQRILRKLLVWEFP